MPRTAVFALLVFLGTANWGFVPALWYQLTGKPLGMGLVWDPRLFTSLPVFFALLACLLAAWRLLTDRPFPKRTTDEETRIGAGFVLLFLYFGYCLQSFQSEVLSFKLSTPSFQPALYVYGAAGLVFTYFLAKPPRWAGWPLVAAVGFLAVLAPFSVRTFPILGTYSDMYFAIEGAGRFFLQGESPYSILERLGNYRCCYWPGLWLSFLPATALGVDLRYLGMVFWGLLSYWVWRGTPTPNRSIVSWFLVLLLLNPWSLLRNDVYISGYLMVWGLFFWMIRSNRWTGVSLAYGWGLASHPFSWALLPIWICWNARTRGLREAGKDLAKAFGMAGLLVLPFVAWDPKGCFEGLWMHWIGLEALPISHFGLGAWLKAKPLLMTGLALVFLASCAWAVWKNPKGPQGLFAWLSAALGSALLVSYHTEHYYFFVPLTLLALHEAVRAESGTGMEDRVLGSSS